MRLLAEMARSLGQAARHWSYGALPRQRGDARADARDLFLRLRSRRTNMDAMDGGARNAGRGSIFQRGRRVRSAGRFGQRRYSVALLLSWSGRGGLSYRGREVHVRRDDTLRSIDWR